MVKQESHSPPAQGPRNDTGPDGGWHLKTAKLNLLGAIGVALITGVLAAVTAYIAKPGTGQAQPAPASSAAPSASPAAPRPTVRFDPVDRPVGICNYFSGTGEWNPDDAELLIFNRPWDEKSRSGTDNYYLDGPATKLPGSTWKGPRQEIGRGTDEGFAVEVTAVVVRGDWARYLSGQVTSPDGMYWAVKKLPPHEAVDTMVVKRDATTELAC